MVHSENRLYLVFEYLDQDLKKYMESVDPAGMPAALIKVSTRPLSKEHHLFAPLLRRPRRCGRATCFRY